MNSGTSKRRVLFQIQEIREHKLLGQDKREEDVIIDTVIGGLVGKFAYKFRALPVPPWWPWLLVAKVFRPRSRSSPMGSRLCVWEASLPHKGVKEPRCGFAIHQLSANA